MSNLEHLLFLFLALSLGLSVGSFLNVVIFRVPERLSVVRPGSRCPVCKYEIRWYDNIPVLSFLLLRGKCRVCKTEISIQYPMIEAMTGILALTCAVQWGFSWDALYYFLFCASLVAITFIDIPYQIIPFEISIPSLILGMAGSFLVSSLAWQDSFVGALVGFSLIAGIGQGYYLLTKRVGIGMGDAWLLAIIGAFLGWKSIPFVLFASAVQGLVVSVASMSLGWMKKAPPLPDPDEVEESGPPEPQEDQEMSIRHAAVPYGPFLSLAALEYLFFSSYIYHYLYSRLF